MTILIESSWHHEAHANALKMMNNLDVRDCQIQETWDLIIFKKEKVNMDKWKRILTPIDKNKHFWGICVFIASFLLIISVIINTFNNLSTTTNLYISYTCDIVITLSTTVLGTFLLNIIYNISEMRKINAISTVSYGDLLPDLLGALEKFNGRYRKEENIYVTISPYTDVTKNAFYKITIRYQYQTNIDCIQHLVFQFNRRRNNVNDYTGGIHDDYIMNEFVWGIDESSFPNDVISENDYKVSQVIIGNHNISNIQDCRKVSDTNNQIKYSIELSSIIGLNKTDPVSLNYQVEFPLEINDLLLVTHEFPTQNCSLTLNYSAIKDTAVIYGMPITGTISPVVPADMEEGIIQYVISGWILPKQGYIFGWWKDGAV